MHNIEQAGVDHELYKKPARITAQAFYIQAEW
jgi:hypothetical protein